MSFIKGSYITTKLTEAQLAELSDSQRLEFPVGLKYKTGIGVYSKTWLVTESYKSGPDDYRRVHCTDSDEDEVMLLSVLKKDAKAIDFSFVK